MSCRFCSRQKSFVVFQFVHVEATGQCQIPVRALNADRKLGCFFLPTRKQVDLVRFSFSEREKLVRDLFDFARLAIEEGIQGVRLHFEGIDEGRRGRLRSAWAPPLLRIA